MNMNDISVIIVTVKIKQILTNIQMGLQVPDDKADLSGCTGRKDNTMKTIYDTLSIRGRVTYAIMCFERYVTFKYPDKDMSAVAEMMWKIIDDSDYIDNSAYRYMEIIPEYLFEANDFTSSEFDYMTKKEYVHFTALLPKPDDDKDLRQHRTKTALRLSAAALHKFPKPFSVRLWLRSKGVT